ncbi:uncharacterized protein V2V93DRAFT_117998 [Kockiozyma suomiensis]|uniref:uncharacterized protein n=1 Tax=Kockiozyma suomiensis TaxID=1337062 RepID=UPI00334384EB
MTSAEYMLANPTVVKDAHVPSKMTPTPEDDSLQSSRSAHIELLSQLSSNLRRSSGQSPPIDPSSLLPPPPPPLPAGLSVPLLDDRESLAYSIFLDKIALDSDFIFDPVLPEDLVPWPHQQPSTGSSSNASLSTSATSPGKTEDISRNASNRASLSPVMTGHPSLDQQQTLPLLSESPSFSLRSVPSRSTYNTSSDRKKIIQGDPRHLSLMPQSLPLISPTSEEPPGSLINKWRTGQITIEDRASLLRAVHRQQGLAFGSDPQFSQTGFKASGEVSSFSTSSQIESSTPSHMKTGTADDHPNRNEAAASEILRQMSQEGTSWSIERENEFESARHRIHSGPSVCDREALVMPMPAVSSSSESAAASPISPCTTSGNSYLPSQQHHNHHHRKRTSSLANLPEVKSEDHLYSPLATAPVSKKSRGRSTSGAIADLTSAHSDSWPQRPSSSQVSGSHAARSQSVSSFTERDNRELLTDAQRRKNHISSEKKRRDVIKQGFEELSHIVPVLRAGGFSKSTVLSHVIDFITAVEKKNEELREILAELQQK